jgi:hypothetical protein
MFIDCDVSGYTYDTNTYLGKDRTCATTDMTAILAAVKQSTKKRERQGYTPYTANLFSLPDLFHDLTNKRINYCGTVRPNRKEYHRTCYHQKTETS